MQISEMRSECANILLEGNLKINEETGDVTVDLTEEGRQKLVEYAILSIVLEAVGELHQKTKDK